MHHHICRLAAQVDRGAKIAMIALTLSGCADEPTGPQSPMVEPSVASLALDDQSLTLARALALGMNDEGVRSAVRVAMRMSPLTEHKLVLQEFIATPSGDALLRSSAARSGTPVETLRMLIKSLPHLDFYMPGREHRRSWKGERAARVAVTLARDSRHAMSNPANGDASLQQTPQFWAQPVFLLHPAERKSRRIAPRSLGPGLTIEDSDDGQISGTIVDYLPDGTSRVTELADYFAARPLFLLEPCDPVTAIEPCPSEEIGGGGGGTLAGDTTYLRDIVILGVCDNGNCDEGNEFEWHTYFSADSGRTWTDRRNIRLEGIPSDYAATVNIAAVLKEPRGLRELITTDVVETDFWSPDDHFDPSPVWRYDENGRLKSEGDLRCNPPRINQYGDFTCGVPPLNYFWREVNQSMRW